MKNTTHRRLKPFTYLALIVAATIGFYAANGARATALPDPVQDTPLAASATPQTIVLAGGCFWGVQNVFQHVKGVTSAVSGYAGGDANTAQYETVSSGTTGHAEAVKLTYDPAQVTLGQLLKVYFSVAHDPTTVNAQGPDHGTQYRSAIFTNDGKQQTLANTYIAQLEAAHSFNKPIATTVAPLTAFYPAEDYHQDYARLHPNDPYIMINDAPKTANLEKYLPALYRP